MDELTNKQTSDHGFIESSVNSMLKRGGKTTDEIFNSPLNFFLEAVHYRTIYILENKGPSSAT